MKELTENLKTLLRQLKNDKSVIRSSADQNFPVAISQNKLHDEKDKKKLPQRDWQITQKKQQPFAKKKKPNEDLELNAPIVTSVEELVGKEVQHLTFDYNGE